MFISFRLPLLTFGIYNSSVCVSMCVCVCVLHIFKQVFLTYNWKNLILSVTTKNENGYSEGAKLKIFPKKLSSQKTD